MPRTMSRGARWIIIIVALFGGIAPWFADYNETHIFNPRWPPHAVFHDGQVLVLASASNILALVFLLRRRADAWTGFLVALGLVSLYWLSLTLAPLRIPPIVIAQIAPS